MRQNLPAAAPDVPLVVIGVIRSAHTEPETTPIQAALNRAGHGTIEVAEPYREGLAGLDGFGYAWLLTWLHRAGGRPGGREGGREGQLPPGSRDGQPPLKQVPFLLRGRQREMGIFATRGPRRINPIGLSLIQLLEVTPETVVFAGVDVVDGTPVSTSSRTSPVSTARPATRRAAGSTSWTSATAAPLPASAHPPRSPHRPAARCRARCHLVIMGLLLRGQQQTHDHQRNVRPGEHSGNSGNAGHRRGPREALADGAAAPWAILEGHGRGNSRSVTTTR